METAIAKSGYQINAVAQGLRKSRTYMLGHVLHSIAPNPFSPGSRSPCRRKPPATVAGCSFSTRRAISQLSGVPSKPATPTGGRDLVHDSDRSAERVAGGGFRDSGRAGRARRHCAHPCGECRQPGRRDGGHGALDRAWHTRIAFIGFDPEQLMEGVTEVAAMTGARERRSVEFERLTGYKESLENRDLPVHDELIDLGDTYYSHERGQRVTRRLLDLPAERRPPRSSRRAICWRRVCSRSWKPGGCGFPTRSR